MLAPLLLLLLVPVGSWQRSSAKPPVFPGLLTIKELAAKAGYETTDVEVTTEDGYITWIHRIGNNSGLPVMIQHGLMVTSESFILRGPDKDLVYFLLREGYDVWLTNQRGTAYNQYHVKYRRSDPRFWDFSFHEAGLYDIPAFISTILQIRQSDQLFFIGHSLGTTIFLVMASMRPEYRDKVKAAVLMSPVAFPPYPEEMSLPVRILLDNADGLYYSYKSAGVYELFPRNPNNIKLLKTLCGNMSLTQSLCYAIFGLVVGEHRTNIEKPVFETLISYITSGTSINTLYHLYQVYKTGEFKEFDYGIKGNFEKYGTAKPPFYYLSRITTPISLLWGNNDPLISEKSVNLLASHLPNLIFSKCVDPQYTHADMFLGKDADKKVYPYIIDFLESFM